MNITEQVNNLIRCVDEFAVYINSLPNDIFLKKFDDWSPRDILAHLIGWNRLTIEGCQQMINGEIPSYFINPGENFSTVNSILVKRYDSVSKQKLLFELEISINELKTYLISLDPEEWESNLGISFLGNNVTIENTVDVLIGDYIQHQEQVKKWVTEV